MSIRILSESFHSIANFICLVNKNDQSMIILAKWRHHFNVTDSRSGGLEQVSQVRACYQHQKHESDADKVAVGASEMSGAWVSNDKI